MAQAQMLTEVKVNGVDVSSRLKSWRIEETFGDAVRECKIILSYYIYNDIPTLANGMTITVKRGTTTATDQFVFNGYVDTLKKNGSEVELMARDKMVELINASVTYSYDGAANPSTEAKGSDIVKDLIETWGGMTASVVDTGTTIVLKKFICVGTDVFSRIQTIADIYDYQIYYDPDDDKVHFEPKGYTVSGNTLYIGGVNKNVSNRPTWIFDNTQCVNRLVVRGATQDVQDDEFFSGDASAEQIFTLAKKPITVQVFEEVGGTLVLKVPGVEGSTAGTYDYEVDKENAKIECTPNWSPASAVDNVKIVYTNALPVPIEVEDTVSQTKYGIIDGEKFFSDIQTVEDAEKRGDGWLKKYSEPFVKVKIKPTRLIDYDAGTKVRVIDALSNENRELVINQVVKSYPHNGDVLDLGDHEWRLAEWGKFTLERIRRLEEENQRNSDLVIQIKTFTRNLGFKRRYMKAQQISIVDANDIMIYGHEDFGTWNSFKWGIDSDAFNEPVDLRIIWPNYIFKETFMDEDFKGTGTATWSTAGLQF